MSDFEYEYNSNSDNDNISYDYSMSDTNYSDDDIENDLIESKTNFIIDMDEDNSSTNTTHSNKKHTSIINNSKPMINNFDSLFNNEETVIEDKSKYTENTKTKGKKIQLKKTETKTEKKNEGENKDNIEDKPDKTIIKEVKLTKKEQNFEFNQENIDFYTKDLDFKKILIKKSPFTNDIQVICLLLKHKIITDYCCSVDKCKVKNLWINNPIQLILHRKNNIQNDLSSFNLELICGNCYLSKYGLDIFKKKEKEIIFKCNICDFPLVKFNNTRKKKGICLSCEKKMNNVFNENIDGKYYTKIQGLYNDNPLLSEEHKEANYYKNTGKSKYSSTYKKPNYSIPSQSSQGTNSKNNEPIVSLNLTLPKIDDLIN